MRTRPDHEVDLGLTPIDDSRSRIADYWSDAEHQPLPEPFASAPFDSPQVVAAYINYVRTAVEWYQPDYLAIGLEANLLKANNPGAWAGFISLMEQTYAALKAEYPRLPVFITVTAPQLLRGWTGEDSAEQLEALDDLLPSSDYLALSFYPYLTNYLTGPLPSGVFNQLAQLSGGRPMAVAETGYPAQATGLPTLGIRLGGTPKKQLQWIRRVLAAATRHEMAFVVNFISRDYDSLWRESGSGDLLAAWRDTGLRDENGRPRPALRPWRAALEVPRARSARG